MLQIQSAVSGDQSFGVSANWLTASVLVNEMRMTSMKLKLDKPRSEPLLHTPSYIYNSHNAALK
jgi:hypothetical protein